MDFLKYLIYNLYLIFICIASKFSIIISVPAKITVARYLYITIANIVNNGCEIIASNLFSWSELFIYYNSQFKIHVSVIQVQLK